MRKLARLRLRGRRPQHQHQTAKMRLRPAQHACACPGSVQMRRLPAGARPGSGRVRVDAAAQVLICC